MRVIVPRLFERKARGSFIVTFPVIKHGKMLRKSREFSVEGEARAFFDELVREFPRVGAAGLALDAVARSDYWAAKAILPQGVSLESAARFFVAANPDGMDLEVMPLAEEWLLWMERKDASARTSLARRQRLLAFLSSAEILRVADLSAEAMDAYLWRSIGRGASRRQIARASARSEGSAIRAFCGWLVKHKRALESNPMDRVEIGRGDRVLPRALRAAELRAFLEAARVSPARVQVLRRSGGVVERRPSGVSGRLVAEIALAAFAGLRPSEIYRLDGSSFSFGKAPFVRVRKLKTGRGVRLVPLSPNLVAWLEAFPPVFPIKRFKREFDRVRVECGLRDAWKNDLLRDTCVSAWLALDNSEGVVARWAGNEPGVIHAYYKDLLTEEEALELFDIWP